MVLQAGRISVRHEVTPGWALEYYRHCWYCDAKGRHLVNATTNLLPSLMKRWEDPSRRPTFLLMSELAWGGTVQYIGSFLFFSLWWFRVDTRHARNSYMVISYLKTVKLSSETIKKNGYLVIHCRNPYRPSDQGRAHGGRGG